MRAVSNRISMFKQVLLLASVFIECAITAQTKSTVTREEYTNICPKVTPIDTSRSSKQIYIRGRVHESHSYDEFIPYATIMIKGTKIGTGSDSLGFYFLDITSIADTAESYTILCSYIAHKTKEVVVKKKISKTTIINFSLDSKPDCEYYGVGADGPKEPKSKKSKK